MKYDQTTTTKLLDLYNSGVATKDIAEQLDVPERSVIAKLSSMGVYHKKAYVNKRGEAPVKKEEYIEQIAALLEVNLELLESLEKANKSVLVMIAKALDK